MLQEELTVALQGKVLLWFCFRARFWLCNKRSVEKRLRYSNAPGRGNVCVLREATIVPEEVTVELQEVLVQYSRFVPIRCYDCAPRKGYCCSPKRSYVCAKKRLYLCPRKRVWLCSKEYLSKGD